VLEVPAADDETILFVERGCAALENGSRPIELARWTGLFVPPGEVCRVRNDGGQPVRLIGCRPSA
jgi:mannose-6-phosphate isomerase-like protein (cupin superfamily)